MTTGRPRPLVGANVRRWRMERGLTLADLAEASGLNLGYLSQIENDKATPSLQTLAAIAAALDVATAWFLIDERQAPTVVRAGDRPVTVTDVGRIEHVDGRTSRDVTIIEVGGGRSGARIGTHAHAGDEHHIVLRGRFRLRQGEHVVELGPGDYLRWDGTIPHDGEIVDGDDPAILIIRIARSDGPGARLGRSATEP